LNGTTWRDWLVTAVGGAPETALRPRPQGEPVNPWWCSPHSLCASAAEGAALAVGDFAFSVFCEIARQWTSGRRSGAGRTTSRSSALPSRGDQDGSRPSTRSQTGHRTTELLLRVTGLGAGARVQLSVGTPSG
jgi:hypothetical protein